jgi:hypothetical protein
MYHLYYCFDDAGLYRQQGTHFSNFNRLLLTGIVPSSLTGYAPDVYDVTVFLADKQHGKHWGTLHPTIYGWSFIDMNWIGWILAIFFGFLLSILHFLIEKQIILYEGVLSATSLLVFVSMRGSVQYAYAIFVYSLIFILLLSFLYKATITKTPLGLPPPWRKLH